jgi:hypothetical protein
MLVTPSGITAVPEQVEELLATTWPPELSTVKLPLTEQATTTSAALASNGPRLKTSAAAMAMIATDLRPKIPARLRVMCMFCIGSLSGFTATVVGTVLSFFKKQKFHLA